MQVIFCVCEWVARRRRKTHSKRMFLHRQAFRCMSRWAFSLRAALFYANQRVQQLAAACEHSLTRERCARRNESQSAISNTFSLSKRRTFFRTVQFCASFFLLPLWKMSVFCLFLSSYVLLAVASSFFGAKTQIASNRDQNSLCVFAQSLRTSRLRAY